MLLETKGAAPTRTRVDISFRDLKQSAIHQAVTDFVEYAYESSKELQEAKVRWSKQRGKEELALPELADCWRGYELAFAPLLSSLYRTVESCAKPVLGDGRLRNYCGDPYSASLNLQPVRRITSLEEGLKVMPSSHIRLFCHSERYVVSAYLDGIPGPQPGSFLAEMPAQGFCLKEVASYNLTAWDRSGERDYTVRFAVSNRSNGNLQVGQRRICIDYYNPIAEKSRLDLPEGISF